MVLNSGWQKRCRRDRSKASNPCTTQKALKRPNSSQLPNWKWEAEAATENFNSKNCCCSGLLVKTRVRMYFTKHTCSLLFKGEKKFLLLYSCVQLWGNFSKRVLKCTEPGIGHDHTSTDLCCIQHGLLQGVSNSPAEQTGVNPNLSQMVPPIPLRRPKAGSCSSSLGVLAVASQQIRLHSPWIYTLLILSEADSADAQLPQCLEESQLSIAQHKETESLHVLRRNIS